MTSKLMVRKLKPTYIYIILVLFIISGIWTYSSLQSSTIIISYIVDAVILILLVFILLGKNTKQSHGNRDNYKDWITEGVVEKNNRIQINVFTLEDLVKLAKDSDQQVIHDTKQSKYFVFTDEVVYIHDPSYVEQVLDGKQQIGRILLERGIVSLSQIETGLYYQKRVGSRLGDSLVALGFIDETTLYSTLAAQQNIAYYELDPSMELSDTSWLTIMNISKARALQVLPLGRRDDDKLVIACGESAWTGINNALRELFGPDIYIVAARPSHIYEILERIEANEEKKKIKDSFAELLKERELEPYDRLTEEESDQFIKSYHKGQLDLYLFIKGFGLANPNILAELQDKEVVISWLTGKNIIDGNITNLIIALNRLIKRQEAKARKERTMPKLMDLLLEAHYITSEAVDWVNAETLSKKKPIREILENNYLASKETIDHANQVIDVLKKLTVRSVIY